MLLLQCASRRSGVLVLVHSVRGVVLADIGKMM